MSHGDLRKLYFGTTNEHQYAGLPVPGGAQTESFGDVHCIGKRDTKYSKYLVNRAPLLDRSSCAYTREFAAKPLGDHVGNRLMAKALQGGERVPSTPLVNTVTEKSEAFLGYCGDELRAACARADKGVRQVRTQTVKGTGDNMVMASHSHSQHRGPRSEIQSLGTAFRPRPNLTDGAGS